MPRISERVDLPAPASPETSQRMSRTPQRDNPRERALRSELHRRGLRFRLHRRVLVSSRRSVDIAFPTSRTAVFMDGCFWHGCPAHGTWPKSNAEWWRAKINANIARDRDTDCKLIEAGWTVIRVWEHEDIQTAADRIEAVVRRLSS
ncbi:TPA: very short patch repair endonuclease [Pseudomonas aeruginosa]|uniref:very short patch repair endonuclease n=1 Tax=Pseudomonas aeruginosa TaxID=287 RepID=UPI0008FB6A25|nr:very short patch repair endonuclease [Pseudomonas aeruginosa]AZZ15196.1 very short patch repair endonuclease [Pseudomonas aeruginosa]EKN9357003.1 very short patch repair endonuclease [Pseudomonas aeruginosa]MBG5166217.1 very short patch repair endonuclease [Pseudomonas aeruginosa]MBG7305304.1 very short patch repair endonuclease [Pseudomonas aeruginosa]MBO3774364.1 very short patch repair endonuclease [Pseudomonas aeruginosa]